MFYNLLGNSNLKISSITFGCMSLSKNYSQNVKLLHHALDKGINLFDTADLYQKGQNELTIGKAFRGKRQKVIFATKVGNRWRKNGNGWEWNPNKKYILQAVEDSLNRLQTDYIDLYQLHGGTIEDPIDETIEAFEILQQQGKIRYYGISSIRPNVIREYVHRSNIVSVMMQYSLLDRRPEENCLDLLKQNKIGMLARGVLAQGLLVGKTLKAYLDNTLQEVESATQTIHSISNEDRDVVQTALQFVLAHPAVTSAVVGFRTLDQLNSCLEIDKAKPLTNEELFMLRNSLPVNYFDKHR